MSKETLEYEIAIIDSAKFTIKVFCRHLPKDIQKVELEELLTLEGQFNENCTLLHRPTAEGGITVEDNL